MQKIKKEKGIALIALVATLSVLMLIFGVTIYNTKLEVFPTNIIANIFHFEAAELFRVDSEEARKNVKVDFSK